MSSLRFCGRESSPRVELFGTREASPQPCSSKDVLQAVENIPLAISPIRGSDDRQSSFFASDITDLFDWCPVFFFSDGDCCVAGYLLMEGEYRLYRTDVVTDVMEGGRLVTDKDDKCYRLEGLLCKATYDEVVKFENVKAVEEFPLMFKSGFKHGFPEDWRGIIKETINTLLLENSLEEPKKASNTKQSIEQFKHTELPNSIHLSVSPMRFNDSFMTREEESNRGANQNNFTFKIVKEDDPDPVLVSNGVREMHLDRLDSGGPLELISSLKRTRSGRLVKPPLDTWRGQYLDAEGDSITVCPGSEKDPVYLKRLGLKPKPHEDSGYLSPVKKRPARPRKPTRTKNRNFTPRSLTFTRKRRRRFRSSLPADVRLPSSDTDSSQSVRVSLLQRASEKRIYDGDLSDYSVSEKSVQVSPRTSVTCHVATQTTEEDSGIAAGISVVNNWTKLSSTTAYRVSRDSVFDQPMSPAYDTSNFRVERHSFPRRKLSAANWPKISSTEACRVSRSSVFDKLKSPLGSDASDDLPVSRCSPPRRHIWPKMSAAVGSCCAAQNLFDKPEPSMAPDSGAVVLSGLTPFSEGHSSHCFRPQEDQHGKCSCCSVKKTEKQMKTSTPALSSHKYSERKIHSYRHGASRLERMWRMQQEIIATMNVDLDADSETSFEHERF